MAARSNSHSFLDPAGLDFDLPPAQSNPITTIHEAAEEDDEEDTGFIHVRAHHPHHPHHPHLLPQDQNQAPEHHQGSFFTQAVPIQDDYAVNTASLHSKPAAPFQQHQQQQKQQHYQQQQQQQRPASYAGYPATPPTRSLASSPSPSTTSSPQHSYNFSPQQAQQPLLPPQPQTRYQYPRTARNSFNSNVNGSLPAEQSPGVGGPIPVATSPSTTLPLYASRTQRMRNSGSYTVGGQHGGLSSSVDQSGKPILRSGFQPRYTSGGIGGLSSSSESDDESPLFNYRGGAGEKGGNGSGGGGGGGGNGGGGNGGSGPGMMGIGAGANEFRKRFSTYRRRRVRWYQSRELHIVLLLCVVSLVVRLWAIRFPNSVVFDEVHFGGFASKYIRGRFFMDVHPPLAKMLIAFVGHFAGLDPDFDFREIGMDYIRPKVPYVAMRLLGALMGVAMVPMAFFTIRYSGHSLHASILAAVLVLFENSLVTQSRLILLDAPLLFFTAFTTLAWVNFYYYHQQQQKQKQPQWTYTFSDEWYVWLFLTGLGLGLSGSVKWVGLFIIATIGTSTLNQLWRLWGDLRITPRQWTHHFLARAFCLIVVPVAVYMFMFEIHFLLLPASGDGNGFMSAPFQMTLGNSIPDSPLSVAYGAKITIRHLGTDGGYLHSHQTDYETGSKQQQITLYPHKDTNNDWVIQRADGSVPDTLQYVKSGDYVRLMHAPTSGRLHSHSHKPPVTDQENHFEVSAYGVGMGAEYQGDSNDQWRVEVIDHDGPDKAAGEKLHTLRSKFRLIHPNMGCALFSHPVKLPKWAFEQQEVTCMTSALPRRTTWIVESNEYSAYPKDAPLVNYPRPGFLKKFLELNKVMWNVNAGLTATHPYDSRPSSWIWLRRGISFWSQESKHVYLIGNWFTWYMSSFSVVLYALIRILLVFRDKRGYRDNFRGFRNYYEISGGFFFMGWCFHYLPFFLMGRQLFLHHYLPALYFSILLLSVTFDLVCRFMPNRARLSALIIISLIAIWVFRTRSALVYGSEWTKAECENSRLFKTWDYDCYQFPATYKQYRDMEEALKNMTGKIVDPPQKQDQEPGVPNKPADQGENKPHDFMEQLLSKPPKEEEVKKKEVTPKVSEASGNSNKGQGHESNQQPTVVKVSGSHHEKIEDDTPKSKDNKVVLPLEEEPGEGGDDDEEREIRSQSDKEVTAGETDGEDAEIIEDEEDEGEDEEDEEQDDDEDDRDEEDTIDTDPRP
ncbi:hypothetical protein BGW38_000903 [Lunasporangiospora selenospora]|uniref:dolichyl-phosphate-mannose--protein mannosyltransferase n=1 Tax=Lunasporangiospora selenospora TaxID=979761 RepID=A0A9P6FU66_9FUNG|nr:hypothetical protein BGW38_000903 [Lunasporangiospora selenospora]